VDELGFGEGFSIEPAERRWIWQRTQRNALANLRSSTEEKQTDTAAGAGWAVRL
jgi:hypothetical protein